MKQSRAAFTLIEFVIVLVLVGVMIAAIWLAVSTVRANMLENRIAQQIMQVAQNAREKYRTYNDTSGLTTASARQMGIWPPEMLSGTTGARHAQGGTATLRGFADGGGHCALTRCFALELAQLTQRSCSNLLLRIASNDQDMFDFGLYGYAVNVAPGSPPNQLGTVTPPRATELCDRADNSNLLIFGFVTRR